KCRFAAMGSCFYRRALKRARCSQIIVVNHSLLLSGVPIPFDTVVIDEAHTLEDVATEHFTQEFSYRDMRHFLSSLYSPLDGEELLGDVNSRVYDKPDSGKKRAILSGIEECTEEVEICLEKGEEFFLCLSSLFHGDEEGIFDLRFSKGVMETLQYEELKEKGRRLLENLEKLVFLLSRTSGSEGEEGIASFGMEDLTENLAGKASRLRELIETLEVWLDGGGEEMVKYATVAGRKHFERQALLLSPVDVADALDELLFNQFRAVLLTSGTLAVGDSFSFFSSRIGLDRVSRNARMLILESSFDFQSQMQILIVQDMPEPNSPDYAGSLSIALKKMILASQGGVLSLFTNRKLMQSIYEELVCELEREGLPLLCQQAAFSRRRTAEEFIQDEKASLFGTSSFWEGVDARGSTLRVLAVTRIPFESPGRPVFEARCERLRSEGISDFSGLSLPLAALRLKQGVGRLIRSKEDRGQVVILDSRISTRPYGRILLKSLPDAQIKRVSLGEISEAIERFANT
ncbi:MAG: helicase C-terminal domain-containing protein, partial [Actinomycetota bacterium]|nr:helicase C-terminal domain-containing protein [Actinomycetota bacterium]